MDLNLPLPEDAASGPAAALMLKYIESLLKSGYRLKMNFEEIKIHRITIKIIYYFGKKKHACL